MDNTTGIVGAFGTFIAIAFVFALIFYSPVLAQALMAFTDSL